MIITLCHTSSWPTIISHHTDDHSAAAIWTREYCSETKVKVLPFGSLWHAPSSLDNNNTVKLTTTKYCDWLTQRKMNGNKLKPKSPNLNPFLCQPDPIGPIFGSWGPTWPVWTQKLDPKLGWTQKNGLGLAALMYQI